MKFGFQQSVSAPVEVCTLERLTAAIDSQWVLELCKKFQSGDEKAKRQLPLVTWQASFKGKRRVNADAIASGLFMLDVDHVEAPTLVWGALCKDTSTKKVLDECVLVAHVTPSGHGLRFVGLLEYFGTSDLSEAQKRLATSLGITEYDTVTKDAARASFLVPHGYFLKFDKSIFTRPDYVGTFEKLPPVAPAQNVAHQSASPVAFKGQTSYRGIPLREICSALIDEMYPFGLVEGMRNTALYNVARQMAYICDFHSEVIAASFPRDYGLPQSEIASLCASATVQGFRRSRLPDELSIVLKRLLPSDVGDLAAEVSAPVVAELPSLPPLIKDFVDLCPQDFKPSMVMSCLPVLGTITTHVRSVYLDGVEQSTSFFTVVEAPQASGKGFVRPMVNLLLKNIIEEDNEARRIEEAYKQALKMARNAKEQPEEPPVKVRVIPASVSVARLLQRMSAAGGSHLFTFCEEMDTLTKSNRSGAWAQKSDIYRNAFDNAVYGQDYMSESSFSANLPVYYNMLLLGTPNSVNRFFKDVEDGLVSRVVFTCLKDQAGARMPIFGKLEEGRAREIEKEVFRLGAMSGTIDLSFLNCALDVWLEEKRLEFLETTNYAVDLFRRRASVIGFRAGMIASCLYGSTYREKEKEIIAFSLWVANEVINGQIQKFGDQANALFDASKTRNVGRWPSLFKTLPACFRRSDLSVALEKMGQKTNVYTVLSLWKRSGLIRKNADDAFEKILTD